MKCPFGLKFKIYRIKLFLSFSLSVSPAVTSCVFSFQVFGAWSVWVMDYNYFQLLEISVFLFHWYFLMWVLCFQIEFFLLYLLSPFLFYLRPKFSPFFSNLKDVRGWGQWLETPLPFGCVFDVGNSPLPLLSYRFLKFKIKITYIQLKSLVISLKFLDLWIIWKCFGFLICF